MPEENTPPKTRSHNAQCMPLLQLDLSFTHRVSQLESAAIRTPSSESAVERMSLPLPLLATMQWPVRSRTKSDGWRNLYSLAAARSERQKAV